MHQLECFRVSDLHLLCGHLEQCRVSELLTHPEGLLRGGASDRAFIIAVHRSPMVVMMCMVVVMALRLIVTLL